MTRRSCFIFIAVAVLTLGIQPPAGARKPGAFMARLQRFNTVPRLRVMIQRATTRPNIEVGVVAGRFQVLHKDHIKYILAGKKQCKHLVVGITNPDATLTRTDAADPARSKPHNNPMTYYERYTMMRSALKEAGLRDKDFSVVPLPINYPKMYRNYVPSNSTFFVTIYDKWGERKQQQFKDQGWNTAVLWNRPKAHKGISATEVRDRMVSGKKWEHMVPRSVARHLKEWQVPQRLKQMEQE